MTFLFRLSVIIFFFQTSAAAPTLKAQSGFQPQYDIDELIMVLEEKYSTRIFYESEWFSDRSFSASIADLPLEQAVMNIISGMNLAIIRVDEYLVLLPLEPLADRYRGPDTLILTIGDPFEFGRYNRVDFSGRIVDGTTGESLPGAVIYSETTGTGTSSGRDGEFNINLPVGEILLRLSYVGYEDQYRRINLLGPGSYEFLLFEETRRIDEVTIMARRAEANVSRTRMSVISMDSKLLKELPGNLGEQDLIRSMALLPGIHNVGEFGTGFHVRGGSNDQNLILLENVPLFNPSHLFGLISVVNPDMVTEMTIYKGGMPARYGERVSSVMDIRMNSGNIDQFKLTGGIGLINSRLHIETPLVKERVSLSLGGRSSYSNWLLERIPAEELLNSSAGFYDLSGHVTVSLNRNNTISAFAYHNADAFTYAGETEYDYSNTLASLRYNSVLGERLSFSVTGGLSLYGYTLAENVLHFPRDAFRFSSSVDYRSLKGILNWYPDGNHRVELGMNAIRYSINPGILEPRGTRSLISGYRSEREKGAEFSLFISDEFEITDRISIAAGLRYTRYYNLGPATTFIYDEYQPRSREFISDTLKFENNERVAGYGGPEPRLSIRYQIDHASSVKASYNRNNQFINLLTNTAVITPSDTWKLSDPHLKPVTSDNLALGYFRNFSNNMIETSVEVYFRRMSNVPEFKDGAEILMNPFIETGLINALGYSYGMELYAAKNAGRFNGWVSYTFSASKLRTDSPFKEEQINNNRYFPSSFDKPHELVINLNYNISRRWRVAGTFTASTGRPLTLPEMYFTHGDHTLVYYSDRNKYRLPAYHRLDLSITRNETLKLHQRRKGNWTLSLLNVYSRKNPYSVFYEREQTGPITRDSFNMYKLYIIGRAIPVLTYNFSF